MKWLRYILMPLWKTWFVLWFVLPFLLLFPLFYIALRSGHFDFVFKLKRLWSRIICFGSFLYPQVLYQSKKYKLPRPCVIVSNHTSYLDIIFTPFYVDHVAVWIGKYELMKIPLFKYFFVYLDIPVNRKKNADAHKAFCDSAKKIDQNISVVIYPEGTISESGKLRPFKNGAFKLAIEKQVPIVPVVNLNNWFFLQNGGFFKSNGRPGVPKIFVGDPIETSGLTEKNCIELKENVYNFTNSALEEFFAKQKNQRV
jgi:1-acyl-sn-glycerol-3-phosphate acyltransferase